MSAVEGVAVKKFVCLLLMMTVLGIVPSWATTHPSRPELLAGLKSIESDAALQEWVNFYYRHPRPDLAPSAWKKISQAGLFKDEGMRPGFIAFFAALMKKNPGLGEQLVPESRDDDSRYVLAYAAWLANSDDSVKILEQLRAKVPESERNGLKDMMYSVPPELLTKPITSPYDLDALWSSFFATGDGKYIERITSTLTWGGESEPVAQAISEGARRTLVENAGNHSKVLQICEAEMAKAKTPQKDLLAAVIKEAKS